MIPEVRILLEIICIYIPTSLPWLEYLTKADPSLWLDLVRLDVVKWVWPPSLAPAPFWTSQKVQFNQSQMQFCHSKAAPRDQSCTWDYMSVNCPVSFEPLKKELLCKSTCSSQNVTFCTLLAESSLQSHHKTAELTLGLGVMFHLHFLGLTIKTTCSFH